MLAAKVCNILAHLNPFDVKLCFFRVILMHRHTSSNTDGVEYFIAVKCHPMKVEVTYSLSIRCCIHKREVCGIFKMYFI
jgi:hypothetical protein